MKKTAIIMAGGSGERFWPLSRKNKPKQLLKITHPDKTMLREAIDRIKPVIAPEDIFIITGELLLEPIRNELPDLPPQNIIAEPLKRNTAPCLALGASFIKAKYPRLDTKDITVAVLTADHQISPESSFHSVVEYAMDYVSKNKAICTIGIPPNRPETGYGYIETQNGFENNDKPEILPVKAFHEKPDSETAKSYVDSGKYYWNSGMFFWRLDFFIEEMELHLPEIGSKINDMSALCQTVAEIALSSCNKELCGIFESFPSISIDYGLMEKTSAATVAKALINWDDAGSWGALERAGEKGTGGNVIKGNVVSHDIKDCIIYNSESGIVTGALGVENLAIIATGNAFLVCAKDRAQEIKKLVNKLKEEGRDEWL